jgi:hypothetical protein
MKAFNFLLSAFLLLSVGTYGQDTVKRSDYLTQLVREDFFVLKSNKKVREGPYQAIYNNVIISKGNYKEGKRVGKWFFASNKGQIVQSYDYDQHVLSIDSTDLNNLKYLIADSIKATDVICYPVKIGGFFYGLYPLLFQPGISSMLHADFPDGIRLNCLHKFTVSSNGDIIKHEIQVTGGGREKVYILDDSKFDLYFRQFLPASINGRKVECQVLTKTSTTLNVFQAGLNIGREN